MLRGPSGRACPWDHYGAWESWIRNKLPEHCQDDWEDMDGALQAELYALWCELADSKAETKAN